MSVLDEEARNVIDDQNEKKKQGGGGFGANFRRAKQMVMVPVAKVKMGLFRKKKTDWRCSGASSSPIVVGGGCLGKKGFGECFVEPRTGESSFRSNTSDPNDPNFTYVMLKSMIEKNDFYSRECNTHLEFKRELNDMDIAALTCRPWSWRTSLYGTGTIGLSETGHCRPENVV